MKPAPFEYLDAHDVDEAVAALAEFGDEAKVLAGGQSLVPLMNMRLARPTHLVDVNNVAGLDGVVAAGERAVVGALTRHCALENTTLPGPLGRLFAVTAGHIGHLPIRVRGTIGGSLAHCDPVAEWCLVARLLDAELVLRSARGDRVVPAAEFFQTFFTSVMDADELLVEVRLPMLADDHLVGIAEFARRPGDFAIVTAVVDLTVTDRRVVAARICLGGVADVPTRATAAEAALTGAQLDVMTFAAAAATAAEACRPSSDDQASAALRRDLVHAMVERALRDAAANQVLAAAG